MAVSSVVPSRFSHSTPKYRIVIDLAAETRSHPEPRVPPTRVNVRKYQPDQINLSNDLYGAKSRWVVMSVRAVPKTDWFTT